MNKQTTNEIEPQRKYLSLQQAAIYLGFNKEFVRLQAKRGRLRGIKFRDWRFDPADLDDWFQKHATGGTEEKRDTKQWQSVDIRKVVSGTSISCTKDNAYIEALGLPIK